jgi:hypothetical protein
MKIAGHTCVTILLAGAAFCQTGPAPGTAPGQEFGKVPLGFEANVGQADAQIKYLARGNGYTAFLTADGIVLKLTRKMPSDNAGVLTPDEGISPERTHVRTVSAAVRMQLSGASKSAEITPDGPLPSRISYIANGGSPRTPTLFRKVAYRDVWPGVSMLYYGNQRQLEYDFIVAPGASPSSIRLAYDGVKNVHVDAQGNLVLVTDIAEVEQPAPTIYQETGGVRTAIAGGYVLLADRQVGFQVGAYDSTKPLVIDPTLVFASSWGGSGQDYAEAIAVDNNTGETVAAGFTDSLDFPADSQSSATNIFVSKLSADGSTLVFSTYIGGSFNQDARGVAIDKDGNIYLTGQTTSSDFPRIGYATAPCRTIGGCPGPPPSQIPADFFVVELDRNGKALFSDRFGGKNNDYGNAIAVDNQGQVYVAGRTYSPDFPVKNHAKTALSGPSDAFVFVLSVHPPTGADVNFSFLFGGAGDDVAKTIAVIPHAPKSSGIVILAEIFVGGWTSSFNLPTTKPASQLAYGGGSSDGFVAKFDLILANSIVVQYQYLGIELEYATYIGGEGEEIVYGISVDASGIAHAVGYTRSRHFPVTNDAFQRHYGGGNSDVFLVKLGQSGEFQFATYFGGSGDDYGRAVVVDNLDRAYIVGYTDSTDLLVTPDAFQHHEAGGWDIFVARFDNDGQTLAYSSYFGESNDDFAYCVAQDRNGSLYIGGSIDSPHTGSTDVLVFKLDFN